MAESMAVNTNGVEWCSILHKILSLQFDTYNKAELIELCAAIIKSEPDILRHKVDNANFYNSFVILCANYIGNNFSNLAINQIGYVNAACRVLLKYLTIHLQTVTNQLKADYSQIENYLNAIKVLCTGTSLLSTADISHLRNKMKGETPTPHLQSTGSDKETNRPECYKIRSDLSVEIFEQLTSPLRDGHTPFDQHAESTSEYVATDDPAAEIKKLFLRYNIEHLQSLKTGDILLDLCLNLPSIKRARNKIDDALAGKVLNIPSNSPEGSLLRNSVMANLTELKLIMSALNLPILEPLTPSKLEKLSALSMAVLYCALCQAVATTILSGTALSPKFSSQAHTSLKDDDLDTNTANLVQESLHLFSLIGNIIKNSSRAGGHVFYNHILAGTWVLISGLQNQISSILNSPLPDRPGHSRDREDKLHSPSKLRDVNLVRSGLHKFQYSFGVLCVALASKAIVLLTELFDDLYMESCAGSSSILQVEAAPLAITGQFTALQRVARILSAAPLNQLLFYLAIVNYRKAASLRRLNPSEGDTFSQADSTTYYEDMILCSDENSTDGDDDSELILGQWFEQTLAPPEQDKDNQKNPVSTDNNEEKRVVNKVQFAIPDKGDAHGYLQLATNIFHFLNKHFLCSKSAYVTRYMRNGLGEQQMIILAAIIKDIDREVTKIDNGELHYEFSGALSRYTHNLITNSGLNSLQPSLLHHLGISPWNSDDSHAWPLQIYPRTLSVLTQVLLLRPQNEREASIITIWHRVVNTLIDNVLIGSSSSTDFENEDLNVDHAQILLYLFHSLNLMQKKSIVLLLALGIIRCSECAKSPIKESQILYLSRLLLLFDYIMKHLYDAPASLLEQIEWSLFYSTNMTNDNGKVRDDPKNNTWETIELPYRFLLTMEDSMRPRFYILSNLGISNQDVPKLDGLACNFILGTPDKLRYHFLLEALVEILNITQVTSEQALTKLSVFGICSVQYCFTICWRLLQYLPPSIMFIEKLASGECLSPGFLMLYSLVWAPRINCKTFNKWLKDSLVKQGLYVQHCEKLLKTVADITSNLKYIITNAQNCITALTPEFKNRMVTKDTLPPFWHLILLDTIVGKIEVDIKSSQTTNIACINHIQDLFPQVLYLTQAVLHCTRWSLMSQIVERNENKGKFTMDNVFCLHDVLSIASSWNPLLTTLSTELNVLLSELSHAIHQWNNSLLPDLPTTLYEADIIPSENYILKIIDAHLSSLSSPHSFSFRPTKFNSSLALKRLLTSLVKFICEHASKIENTDTKNKAIELLVTLTLDIRTDYLNENVTKTLDKLIGNTETDEHQKRVYLHVLHHTYKLIINYTNTGANNFTHTLNERILHICLTFYEKILEKSSGRQALEIFFSSDKCLVKILLSASNDQTSQQYSTRVLHFFNKLFQTAEKSSTDPSLNFLYNNMKKLINVDAEKLQNWLKQIIIGSCPLKDTSTPSTSDATDSTNIQLEEKTDDSVVNGNDKHLVQENCQLLQALVSFIVKQSTNTSEEISNTLLNSLIPIASYVVSSNLEGAGFKDLMVVMIMLADSGNGKGHIYLCSAIDEWIDVCNKHIMTNKIDEKLEIEGDAANSKAMIEVGCSMLEYINDIIHGILHQNSQQSTFVRALSPPWEYETSFDTEVEWQDDLNDDADSGDDSEDDNLNNKLCTFTITQKEFMNQHWYHCHTCRMLDGVGVCTVCAKVCHKGHDLSYAKYGNFFCDCGAKEDGSCQALIKRLLQSASDINNAEGSHTNSNNICTEPILTSLLRRPQTSNNTVWCREKHKSDGYRNLQCLKDWIVDYLASGKIVRQLLEFITALIPIIRRYCDQYSPVGCYYRALQALRELHSSEKKLVHSDQLIVPTLGSQEGAFENIRMSYSGEQGQTIRQLLSAHIVRRVAMCCMVSTNGRRQHLAVSHEKGKITILQLSTLLKQADSQTRKLTLTRLSSAPIPFTVLSMTSNMNNDDYLAVCGLKDCHILTFTTSGTVSDHLVLHPQLETGNFIIKAIWLPGSQTILSLITADFVKIYDLSKDALSPQYYFLVPSGKIRDCTFVYEDDVYYILLMSSTGHIYTETLNEESSAKHGSFYITNTIDAFQLDATDSNGQVAGGGVSIYYSHVLRLVFYSYAQGKNYVSPLTSKANSISAAFPIILPPVGANSSKTNGSKTITPQPLCQWHEIPNHPGLICCSLQSSNNPVILMVKPDKIHTQEVKLVPSKSKIMDMVSVRHYTNNELRTTFILLCEDGSLKMYMANASQCNFWMSKVIQPTQIHLHVKSKKKKTIKLGKTASTTTFPVDFFEHCQIMNDVEFSGNDLLQFYNSNQIKHRLNATGLYVACNKPLGFTIDISNSDSNIVMVGIRVLVGNQDILRAPSFIEIFGRIVSLTVARGRWFDIPFSREESLQADKKITVLFGPSQDAESITMVDSIKVYGKTKEAFGWPEDGEEGVATVTNPLVSNTSPVNIQDGKENQIMNNSAIAPNTKIEKIVCGILETLDGTFALCSADDYLNNFKDLCLKTVTQLLTLPTSPSIQMYSKSLLSTLHKTKLLYYGYKDQALLQFAMNTLNEMTENDTSENEIDAENYYRLILIVRSIAVCRPQNLVKYSDSYTSIQDVVLDDPLDVKVTTSKVKNQHLLLKLMDVLWILHSQIPQSVNLAPVVVPGLKHTEQVIYALIEIVHAFNSCDTYSNITIAVYLQLLLCKDPMIAFSAKQALSKVLKPKSKRRRVFIPSPPYCVTPPVSKNSSVEIKVAAQGQSIQPIPSTSRVHSDDQVQRHFPAIGIQPFEDLLGSNNSFPPLIDLNAEADDETMVELAIALSLQEHDLASGQDVPMDISVLSGEDIAQSSNASQSQEVAHFSDTTASAGDSDDEGSTAATDGSTLRTSPAEQVVSVAGSESGGSGVDSITGEHVSGRSSVFGDNVQEGTSTTGRSDIIDGIQNEDNEPLVTGDIESENDPENSSRLHILRLQLLERLTECLPKLKNINGTRAIPLLQVILQLTSDLDSSSERDRSCFNTLLGTIILELQMHKPEFHDICTRNNQREIQLVLLRLLSVLMSRHKSSSSSNVKNIHDNSTFISRTTASVLRKANIINYCNKMLQALLPYWNTLTLTDDTANNSGSLLRKQLEYVPPDLTPFFLKQFVKENANDVFLTYPQLLTEMALRLPYQVQKCSDISEPVTSVFDNSWYCYLCEYMMFCQIPFVRRQVRKLLLFVCGTKEKYRQLRDMHTLNTHMMNIKQCCLNGGYQVGILEQTALLFSYDTQVGLVDNLKCLSEVAINRAGNWQRFCLHDEEIIPFLFHISCLLEENVTSIILNLIQCAIVMNSPNDGKSKDLTTSAKSSSSKKDREKSDSTSADIYFDEANCVSLVDCINKRLTKEIFTKFIKTFLLETNITSMRWQAHSLILAIHKNSPKSERTTLLELLWSLWPIIPAFGRKATQFVDLLGYFTLEFFQQNPSKEKIAYYVEHAMMVLKKQNKFVQYHPNATLYAHIGRFVEMDGYYLESEPCLVCNNPEIPVTSIKLSAIKVDSKFTTTTQIVKLISSHTISKITIKISDIKRTKMVRTINIFYNNRSVQAVVELKNKPTLWHKAKAITLQSGQAEIKVEFPLPIVACNLMMEYADFYENIQASSETLQCPRCSAAVPANPGVCSNCGENVFQCHKCRAINYDEKDPFLCNACGFCKYAKFDVTLVAKSCCAVEPIESDEDRKKTLANINTLLEKADRAYKQLISNKPHLESLINKINQNSSERRSDDTNGQSTTSTESVSVPLPSGSNQVKVNKTIQMLAQQYCNECRNSFDELSKIILRILVSRKELVAYDRKNKSPDSIFLAYMNANYDNTNSYQNAHFRTKCYGCAISAIEYCLIVLHALALNPKARQILCEKGLIQELTWNNLRSSSYQIQEEVKLVLCVLSRDSAESTEELCNTLLKRITLNLDSDYNGCDLNATVRHEISLFAALVAKEDECWEMKLRCMTKLFLKACRSSRNPLVMDIVILPCLKILENLLKAPDVQTKRDSAPQLTIPDKLSSFNITKFLNKLGDYNYLAFKRHLKKQNQTNANKQARNLYLTEKYAYRWLRRMKREKVHVKVYGDAWIKSILFNDTSRLARQVICNILEMLSNTNSDRKANILILLTGFLHELNMAGESAAEFLNLYQNLIQQSPWKQYLTVRGVLTIIAQLITNEIDQLHHFEETTLTSDLTQGYALSQLTDLMASFLEEPSIRRQYKGKLVGSVLNGYLSLRRLVVQRTRLIDETRDKLLELLEEMTTGTEEETKSFMIVCIDTVKKCNIQDTVTPVFIFERLCSIIYPEENDVSEFFLTLEKDAQQEDFLQGRMLGNPYSSLEAGLGPLMRDVKNKICQDCELIALLEDDNGMELLVHNKIISLDLAVKDVYKKIWLAEGGDPDAMRVIYRMRGLLGDATEEFVEVLADKSYDTVDDEEVYKLANVLADSNGLEIMLKRLGVIQNIASSKSLLQVLLKLFCLCIKVRRCQEVLINPDLSAMEVFLRTLQLTLDGEFNSTQATITEQLLHIMEIVLTKATNQTFEAFEKLSLTFGGPEYVEALLKCASHSSVQNSHKVMTLLSKVLAALVYGNKEKMAILIQYFAPVFDLIKYNTEHSLDDQKKLEMLCVLVNEIERNAIGDTLKDYIVEIGVLNSHLNYITSTVPCEKPTLLRTDTDELKDFISKPALKYSLRFLTGLSYSHEKIQMAIATVDTISIIHRLEQVSSDEHVGSLAENLLEALCTNPTVAQQIEEVRQHTRAERKRLAMAMREKQLGQLGMRANEKGQVTVKVTTTVHQIDELCEESGIICCICREGYKYQPTKMFGIYTFTKRCTIEEFELNSRKTSGYSTVTHFNTVHIDCHINAVRLARTRDEWESAALQNANTKCNGLLPLWGPQVQESAFASCLARHNTYIQDATNYRDIGYVSTIHDLKLLLLKFAFEKPFHEDTGGGGPESNMHLLPYLIHTALYVINTTRVNKREEANLQAYLSNNFNDRWVSFSYETEGPLYWLVMSVLLQSNINWTKYRLSHLNRIIFIAQMRTVNPNGGSKTLTDKTLKEYCVYKPYLIFFALIDEMYKRLFKDVQDANDQWCNNLANYIRNNDEALLRSCEGLFSTYINELLPCTSFAEFCDVTGLLEEINNPDAYIEEMLNKLE